MSHSVFVNFVVYQRALGFQKRKWDRLWTVYDGRIDKFMILKNIPISNGKIPHFEKPALIFSGVVALSRALEHRAASV